jgi:PAS domain-containing protein
MVRLNIGDELATLRLSDEDDIKVGKALDIAKSAGAAPLIIVQAANQRWMLRVSSFEGNSGKQYILQFSRYESLGASKDIEPITGISLSDIISHLPEGMVAVNTQDIITHANPAFAALVNHDNSKNMLGQPIDQWLQVPGKNASSIWGKLQREDRISNFTSRIDTPSSGYDVSISARRVASANSELMLMLIRPLAA